MILSSSLGELMKDQMLNAWNPGSQTVPCDIYIYIYIYIYIKLEITMTRKSGTHLRATYGPY